MGFAASYSPIPNMLRLGMNVGLGTDGVKENNRADIFQEMKNASMMHRIAHENAQIMKAEEAFKMATVNGSRALKMKSGEIREGSLLT